jgi:hypothetical protein
MSNFLYHNKWHSFNHHTVPSEGYPDSAMDPIASREFPFKGIFFNAIPVSAAETRADLRTYDSDSYGWWRYTSLTYRNSADWSLWGSVRDTTVYYLNDWNDAYHGFQFWSGYNYTPWESVSAKMFNLFNNTLDLSGAWVWPLSTEGSIDTITPTSGRGWNIALSAITWRTNVSAINTRQKNAIPAPLSYNADNTLFWDVSTSQTAYLSLTEDRTLTATRLFNVKRGGKYTMWISLDYCPLEKMNLVFDPASYRIQVVKFPRNQSYYSNLSVIRLQPNNLTKIDFVFDGRYMLGKATHYQVFLPTPDDLYYQGLCNTLDPNPWYVDGLSEPGTYILPQTNNGIKIQKISDSFTSVSAIYIAGTGVDIVYFGQGFNFFNFNLVGARWQTELDLTSNIQLTSSFDRIYGDLSGGNYNDKTFAVNLFGTPSFVTAPDIMLSAYPNPPYKFANFKLVSLTTCLSTLNINVRSGKDRDIKSITINRGATTILSPVVNGLPQRYNFFNERQAVYLYKRIQTNVDFKVTYQAQAPVNGLRPILWFDFIDSFTTTINTNRISKIVSKPREEYFLSQGSSNSRPDLCQTEIFRCARFRNTGGRTTNMTLNLQLTSLDQSKGGNFELTQFTVIEPTKAWYYPEEVVWWMGDYRKSTGNVGGGYGVVLSGNKICFGGFNSGGSQKFNTEVSTNTIELNKPFILTTIVQGTGLSRRSSYYINEKRFFVAVGHTSTLTQVTNITSFEVIYGRAPGTNSYSDFKLHAHILYDRILTTSKIRQITKYLTDKYYLVEGYNSSSC